MKKWWTPYYEAYLMHTYLPECQRPEGLAGKAWAWWIVVHLIPCSCIIVFLIWIDMAVRR